jgi:uncharacterized membrane protein YeaQ/YmgE (transglycosylase-associated protein family)
MDVLLQMFGLPYMPTYQLVIFLALIAVALLLFGWIADMTLGNSGYGVMLNGLVMLVGAVGGVLLWRKLGYRLNMHPQAATAVVATASGMVMLLFCTIMRRWL